MIQFIKNNYTYLYYLLLLFILASLTSMSSPSTAVRLLYLAAFGIPILTYRKDLFPAMLVLFVTVGTSHFAYTFMPSDLTIYFVLTIVWAMSYGKGVNNYSNNGAYLLFLAIILLRNYMDEGTVDNIFYSYSILFIFLSNKDCYTPKSLDLVSASIIIMSVTLSIVYLTNMQQFIVSSYVGTTTLQRAGWTDPNYFSCILGMGTIASFIMLSQNSQAKSTLLKVTLISAMVLIIITQVLLASRGGIISTGAGLFVALLLSKTSLKTKIIYVIIFIVFVVYLLSSDYTEVLKYRFLNDDTEGGGGRVDIWISKLQAFEDSGLLAYLFGYGYNSATTMTGQSIGFHNDFVAMLCAYGVSGFIVFMVLLLRPVVHANKQNRPLVLAAFAYLVTCSLSLEPFSLGSIATFGFFYYINVLSKVQMIDPEE